MTTPRNLTDLSESELAAERQRYEGYVFDLETELHEARKIVGELKAEQDRRAIEAWWLEHPGLRIEVGDTIVFTEIYGGFQPGTMTGIQRVLISDEGNWIAYVEGWSWGEVQLSYEDACNFRQAWLDREAEHKPDGG